MSDISRAAPEDMINFCYLAEVRDLLSQLNDGLIHPIEYADKILVLAYQNGLVS